jgi:hypothetical protein
MPKISKAQGPTIEPDLPAPEGPQTPVDQTAPTPADVLRSRGKLGPYGKGDGDEPATTDVGHGAAAYEEEDPPQEVFTERDGPEGDLVNPEVDEQDDAAQDEGKTSEEVQKEGEVDEAPARDQAPARPAPSASRAKWAEYAERVSGEPVPEDTTKAMLVEQYGEDPSKQ